MSTRFLRSYPHLSFDMHVLPGNHVHMKKVSVHMRFDPAILAALDAWCAGQDVPPTRSAAIRQAVLAMMFGKRAPDLPAPNGLCVQISSGEGDGNDH